LQAQIQEIHDYADDHADVEQQRYTDQYNTRAVDKHFQICQQVIVLIPDSTNKFLSRWQGLGTIVSVKSPYSYLVELEQGKCSWLHANKLRPYHARVNALIGNCAIAYESDEELGTLPVITPDHIDLNLLSNKIDPAKLQHLNVDQKDALLKLLDEFADVFVKKPGLRNEGGHEIHVTHDFKPRRLRAYKVPELLKPEVARQLQELLDMGFIHKSTSAMASPIVCVLKGRNRENGVRLCCDYHYLNKYTRGDAYPTPDITDVIHKVGKAQWITSWDTRSGYWQIYVKPEHRWLTAFVTDFGLFEWVHMPFGLKCASNSFMRALQQLLFPLRDFCDSYVDDIATFTSGWTEDRQDSWPLHLEQVRAFLLTMRKASLTLKLEKCKFAQSSVTFVGHTIGSGLHGPDPHKAACVQDMKPPNSKKEVRQILGFFSYFRTYIIDLRRELNRLLI